MGWFNHQLDMYGTLESFFWFSIIWGKLSQACHKAINVSVHTKHIPFRHVVILAIWSLISNRFTIHMRFPSFSSICWFARPKAFSADHGAALLKDGRMFLWGSNRFGQSPGVVSVGICQNIPLAESDSEWFRANLPWFLRYVFFGRGFVRDFLWNEQGLVSWLGSFDETMFFRRVATRKVKETGPRLSISISCFVIQTPT